MKLYLKNCFKMYADSKGRRVFQFKSNFGIPTTQEMVNSGRLLLTLDQSF